MTFLRHRSALDGATMSPHAFGLMCLIGCLGLSACSETQGEITRDTRPFDRIDANITVTLLGTEPMWKLQIEPDADGLVATYTASESASPAVFAVSRFAGNNGVGYSGTLNGSAVQAALTPSACNDGMSDRGYPYIATVAIGDRTFFGCAYTDDEMFEEGRTL